MKVIVFTAVEDPDVRRRAFEAGAAAFVLKLASSDELLMALKCLDDNRD
jgi:DNA-binding NarL/FixJ family response regulator